MENQKKVIIVSLAASLMAVILYVFGMTLAKGNIIIETIDFVMGSLLDICAAVSLFKNYKKYKSVVFIYLIIINILLEALFIGKLLI